ncbi:MAG: lipopolysaccharide biosynthesis protein [Alphaproteobacteria bacterium]|nr:lipopolysaccharide biosynthesis protein [Alphaproteobacteria bacterium]
MNMDLRFYLSLFLRRLHWFLLFVIVGSAAGLTLAKVLPPVFIAKARLLVESEQIPDNLAASTVQTEATEQLEIIQQRILTRDTLLDMANRFNIYADASGGTAPRVDADTIVKDMRQRITIQTTGGTGSRGPVRATLVAVSFQAKQASLAATVTNELVTQILREDISMRTGSARQTLEFFQQEVSRLDTELSTRGSAILTFQEANQEALPDSLDFRRTQQTANQERLLQLNRDEAALRDRRNSLVSLQEAAAASGGNTASAGQQTTDQQRLQSLRDQLSGQLAVLSPQNPKIRILQSQIDSLASVVEAQQARAGVAQDGSPLSSFDLQLAEIDAQLDFLASQKVQVEKDLADLKTSIEATPGNAITLDTLQRDYANVRTQYDQAVANKARAETGDVIETLAKGQRISVLEQAVVPSEPERPNRPAIAAAGVGGGFVLGLAMVVLLEIMNKGIRRPGDLTQALGITTFATLPYFRTTEEIWRRRAIIYVVLGGLLIGIPLALWAVNAYYMPLDLLIDTLGQRIGLASLVSVTPIAAV